MQKTYPYVKSKTPKKDLTGYGAYIRRIETQARKQIILQKLIQLIKTMVLSGFISLAILELILLYLYLFIK